MTRWALDESGLGFNTLTTLRKKRHHLIPDGRLYHELIFCSDENHENWYPTNTQEFADVEINWEEVGSEFQYDPEWDDENEKKGEMSRKPVIPEASFMDADYAPLPGERLVDKFEKSGLQIIVKMASIKFTPENPEFPLGGWHMSLTWKCRTRAETMMSNIQTDRRTDE